MQGAMKPDELRTLSDLLEQAFDLLPADREAWIASLQGEALRLAPTLRELLAKQAAGETGDLIDRLPEFTAPAASAQRPSEFTPGAAVGPYRLLHELGRGGMGEVWLAERTDGQLQRRVALKLPLLHARRSVLVQRFERERDILGSLTHAHIARLYDAGVADDGQPYLALEHVEGQPITAYCDERRLDVRARVQLLQQVLQAVQYAHAHLVIHRDLKPNNVLVTAEGQAMLLDFGIAKLLQEDEPQALETELTREGGRAMTLAHAAPEQVIGGPISTATDIWALGVLLYEMIAGRPPFRHATRSGLEQAILNDEPARPSHKHLPRGLAADLDTIMLKALKKAPAERYTTVDALAEDLARWLDGAPVRAQRDSAWYRTRKFVRRNRIGVAGGAGALLALAATAGVALWQASHAREQTAQAREQTTRAQQQTELAQKEARRAQAVQDFMLDIFRSNRSDQPDPQKAQQTTARQLLDIGAARMEQSLKDAPESRLQVMDTLAAMYSQLGLPLRALELERGRVELARASLPADDPRRAEAAIALARHLFEGAEREQARALIEEARTVLDMPRNAASPARGLLLILAARFYRFESLRDTQANADAAIEFYRRYPQPGLSLVIAHAIAGRSRAVALDHTGAESLLSAAHALALKRGQDAGAAVIVTGPELSEEQHSLGRFAEAERTLRETVAASVRIHGPTHRETLSLRMYLAYLLLFAGRSAEGHAEQGAIRAAIDVAGDRLEPAWRGNADFLLARNLYELGQPAQLVPVLRVGIGELAVELPRSAALVHRRRLLAEALTALGQLEEADTLLDQSSADWERYTSGVNQPWMNSNLWVARGRLRLAQGRPAEAVAVLQQVVPSRLPADAVVDLWLLRRDVALAEAWLALAEPARAVDVASTVLAALRRIAPPYRLPHIEASAWQALGQAQARLGDAVAARVSLERAVSLRREHNAPGSLWLAQAQRALAETLAASRR